MRYLLAGASKVPVYCVTHTNGYSTMPQAFHMRSADYVSALERAKQICGKTLLRVVLSDTPKLPELL